MISQLALLISESDIRRRLAPALILSWTLCQSHAAEDLSYDEWKIRNFGSADAPHSGRSEDFDGDGISNGDEYTISTNPKDSSSRWRASYAFDKSSGEHELRYQSITGRSLVVEHSTDMRNWLPWDVAGNTGQVVRVGEPAVIRGAVPHADATGFFRFQISMTEPVSDPPPLHDALTLTNHNAFLMAMGAGSRIEIHAADRRKAAWLLLAEGYTALPGDVQITVDNRGVASNWEVGDRIAIATSYYHHRRTEVRTITNVVENGNLTTLTLDDDLNYRHYGEVEHYSMGAPGERMEWAVDMRAEVALLSRNVVIQGDSDSVTDRFGGHVMVMHDGEMHVSGAEFRRMGQDGHLARYPLHWHNSGDVTGQYVINNSIHDSYHKGITIHGTQKAWVENNVIFETLGHGIFLENGTEEHNVIKSNLVFNQREAVTPVIASDKFTVSSYWSNNPKNHFLYNRAAGSRGSGFWIAGNRKVIAELDGSIEHVGYVPRQLPFGLFIGNTAHSNLKTSAGVIGREMTGIGLNVGQEIDEAQIGNLVHDNYAELHTPLDDQENDIRNLYISDFTAYMNEDVGLFLRSFGGHSRGLKLADNVLGLMTTGGQLIEESVFIGHSQNGKANHRIQFESIPDQRYGVGLYTDSVVIDRSLFTDFQPAYMKDGQWIRDSVLTQRTGANNSSVHVMKDVEIAGNTPVESYFMSNGKLENRRSDELSVSSVGFVDDGGAFTGSPGSMVTARLRPAEPGIEDTSTSADAEVIVPGFNRAPFQQVNAGLIAAEDVLDAHVSNHQVAGQFKLFRGAKMKTITRSDGPQIRTDLSGNGGTGDQLVVFAYKDASYGSGNTLSYTFEWDGGSPEGSLDFIIRDFAKGQQVYLILKDIPPSGSTTIQGSDELGSLGGLLGRDPRQGTAHFWDSNDLHLMLSATDESYHPQVGDLATIDHRVCWDSVRVRPNGSGRDTPEGVHFVDEKEFRPFAKQLEADFGQGVDWRRNPIQFRDPLIKEAEWLAYLDSYDPFLAGSTSRTVSDVSGLPRWSDAATWSGSIPGPNTIVVIKAGQQVVLDQSATVKGILIVGAGSALIIVDDPGKAIQLTSDYVLALDGALFQAGTEANHLETEFILELSGDDPALVLPVSDIVDGNTVESVAVAQ